VLVLTPSIRMIRRHGDAASSRASAASTCRLAVRIKK
jgi:hypothetical protein